MLYSSMVIMVKIAAPLRPAPPRPAPPQAAVRGLSSGSETFKFIPALRLITGFRSVIFTAGMMQLCESSSSERINKAHGRQAEGRQAKGRQAEGRQTEGRQDEGRQAEGMAGIGEGRLATPAAA